jgi:GxxExxY protein
MSPLVQDPTGNDLTYRIIGAAMAVHNALGPGYKEEVYERGLAAELQQRGINTQRQYPVEVWHADSPVALFYLDIFVEEQVVVEVKALSHLLTNDEIAQVINYLKAANAQVGLLFNFGRRKLEYKRIFPPRSVNSPIQRLGRDNVKRSNLPDLKDTKKEGNS